MVKLNENAINYMNKFGFKDVVIGLDEFRS